MTAQLVLQLLTLVCLWSLVDWFGQTAQDGWPRLRAWMRRPVTWRLEAEAMPELRTTLGRVLGRIAVVAALAWSIGPADPAIQWADLGWGIAIVVLGRFAWAGMLGERGPRRAPWAAALAGVAGAAVALGVRLPVIELQLVWAGAWVFLVPLTSRRVVVALPARAAVSVR